MRRSTGRRAPYIEGDELEQHRIQLEHNLRNSEAAIHLSSASEDEGPYYKDDGLESVEYPRHNSGPVPFTEFPSFERRVRDSMADEDLNGHAWSYRTVDDYEEGINPYVGDTMSTPAHHASAVTLSAGLGGRGSKRDASISGAEYDPERPLNDIIAGVNSKLSVFDTDYSRSKHPTVDNMTCDPLVAEDTAELDKLLETGHQRPSMHSRSVRLASPVTSGSSSHSESDNSHMANTTLKNRPKLSDALRNVTLSPKRPRSPQSSRSLASSTRLGNHQKKISSHIPAPRPAAGINRLPSQSSSLRQPDVHIQPPTPSVSQSHFESMARQLSKEIKHEKEHLRSSLKKTERSHAMLSAAERNRFEESDHRRVSSNIPRSSMRNKSKVQLPDVTGLTNAIESPAKLNAEYYAYQAEGRMRQTENRLLQTLNIVQQKLQQLEEENSISRRRVRELEMELEDCKREVARERTHLIEQEELLKQQQRRVNLQNSKGKLKARDLSADASECHERYKEAVEEKKALEALISSLRTHLARLTSELSSHRELLIELRTLRDEDSHTLKEKGAEIVRLKDEVERLAGEVEVLRGVVEEGLKERRAAKEASMQQDHDHHDHGHHNMQASYPDDDEKGLQGDMERGIEEGEEEDKELEAEDPDYSSASRSSRSRAADKTIRTDIATQGSSRVHNIVRNARFMDSGEFERISAEIQERRSDPSISMHALHLDDDGSLVQSPSPHSTRVRMEDTTMLDASILARRASSSPAFLSDEDEEDDYAERQPEGPAATSRQPNPAPLLPSQYMVYTETRESRGSNRQRKGDPNAPFPRIRGERLERMFFSAPEHNAETCTVCHRRRRQSDSHPISPIWIAQRNEGFQGRREGSSDNSDGDDDEGFAEGSDESGRPNAQTRGTGKQREISFQDIKEVRKMARQEGLPPQTVVARVIRELEDDFTHYKSIYIELADQYKEMDAASNVAKRNMLADHLREVVDILEQKGNQIASLYDLLSFDDKPLEHKTGPSAGKGRQAKNQ